MGKVRVMARYNKPPRKYPGLIADIIGWCVVAWVFFLCYVEMHK